jgi:hypothetical protein
MTRTLPLGVNFQGVHGVKKSAVSATHYSLSDGLTPDGWRSCWIANPLN